MFEHVTLFLSFIYAIAVTHQLSAATELILARDRVKPSGLLIAWMALAFLVLIVNWLSAAALGGLKHWTIGEALMWFALAFVQYFTCSLASMRVERHGEVDMPAFFDRHRPVITGAVLVLALASLGENYLDRGIDAAGPRAWIGEDLEIAPMAVLAALALAVPARWAQWLAIAGLLAGASYFLGTFVVLG